MRFRLAAILFCLIAVGEFALPSPAGPKADADAWVKAKVDALVSAARAAYENDDALPAYKKVLNSIAVTIRRRKLAEDAGFARHYREFIDYVQTASLALRADHELGFEIPDKQYFEETRQYVQIPQFLMAPSFLRSVSRYETLDRAKAFLRQLNQSRQPSDQLILFSYTSRHLGTPDNDDSFERLLIVVQAIRRNGSSSVLLIRKRGFVFVTFLSYRRSLIPMEHSIPTSKTTSGHIAPTVRSA